jgi:hypothetical protein
MGCGPGGRPFARVFPAIDGDPNGSLDINALPVKLHDQTGLVAGFDLGHMPEDDMFADISSGHVRAALDEPETLLVLWRGGACESDVEMVLTGVADHLDLSINANHQISLIATGCPALGVARAVVIHFVRPIDPTDVHVSVDIG